MPQAKPRWLWRGGSFSYLLRLIVIFQWCIFVVVCRPVHVSSFPWRPGEGTGSPGAGITAEWRTCVLGTEPGSSREQCVFLGPEPSLQPEREVSYCSPNGRKLHPEHCWPCLPRSSFHSCSHVKTVLKVTCVHLKLGLNMNITVNSFMFSDHQCAFSRQSGLNTVIVLSPKISGDLKILSPEVLAWTGLQHVIHLLPSLSPFLFADPTLSPSLSSCYFSVSPPSCRSFTWSRFSIIFTKTGSGLNIWRN